MLNNFGKDAHLVLLQEAQTTPELVKFATSNYLAADQVPALVLPQHPSGVMTLASAHPIYCCPLREREPILRLAKSALVTVYPLPDSRLLMVVNIHAVKRARRFRAGDPRLRSQPSTSRIQSRQA